MRLIAHIFIHNFFVAAALNSSPGLAESPVAVIKNSRVIDTSPAAQADGVLIGLSKRHALRANPLLACIELAPQTCAEQTAELARQCYDLAPRVEIPAENEAFVDLSGNTPPTVKTLQSLAGFLVPRLGTFVTISLAPCRLLAKAATLTWLSQACRPNPPAIPGLSVKAFDKFRLFIVKSETAGRFASVLPVEMMWPLDYGSIKRLKSLGLTSCGDINGIPSTMLERQFGTLAPLISNYSRGIDESNVPVLHPPDRIVFHSHCSGGTGGLQLETVIKQAATHISGELRNRGEGCRELALSVFFEDYRTATEKTTHTAGKHDIAAIYHTGMSLLSKISIARPVTEIFLAAGQLTANRHSQLTLFEDPKSLNRQAIDHRSKLAVVCQGLAAKYAPGVITMGKAIPVSRREQMLMFVDPWRGGS